MYNIVLLEDNYVIRQIISIALHEHSKSSLTKIKLYTSSNGVEGLGYIYVTEPNLIIVDTTLPKYSGKDVLDFLRYNDKLKVDKVQIIILVEGESDVSHPEHFLVLDKTAKNFTQQILEFICHKAGIKFTAKPSLLSKIYARLVYLSSQNDRLLHSSHSLVDKLLSWPVRASREILITILLSIVFTFKTRLPNENIDQEHADLIQYRVKYYPTLVIGASALLLLVFQLGALGVSQFALLRNLTEPSFAAATFTVDSTADTVDFSAGDGVCDTDDSTGDGPCTLRAAIAEANALAGADTINFNIAGAGPHTIQPASALPSVSESLFINASSQPAADCSTLSLQIELDGSLAGAADGLTYDNADSGAILGLAINNFRDGVVLTNGSTGNTISCNIVGLDVDGTTIQPNTSDGIVINTASDSNTIGGSTTADSNVIGGNSYHGISIDLSDANIIENNYIGTDVTGLIRKTNGDPAGGYGIRVTSSNNTEITSNVITGSLLYDISIDNSDGVSVLGNYIGTDRTGNAALNYSTSFSSLSVRGDSDDFTLGGYLLAERNVFSEGYIEFINDDAATQMSNIAIINNYFGLSANGSARISQISPYFSIDKGVSTATLINVLIDSNFMVGNYDTNPTFSCR